MHVGHVSLTEFAGFQLYVDSCALKYVELRRVTKQTVIIKEFYHTICNVIHKILKQE